MISYHPSTEAPVEAMYRGITGVLVRIEEHPSLVQMKDVDYHFFFDTFTMRGWLEVAGSGAIEKIGGHICSQAASQIWKSQCSISALFRIGACKKGCALIAACCELSIFWQHIKKERSQ